VLVKVCDRIIGPAELTVVDGGIEDDAEPVEVAA
jgi:hypothetical protein